MLRNLLAEMARTGISNCDIAKTINKSERSVRDRISELRDFSFHEAVIVRDKHFPGESLEYLFMKSTKQQGTQNGKSA